MIIRDIDALSLIFIAFILMSPIPAWAHQFGLIFVAPLSGKNAEQGKQALDGFMFATREEDAHAFEESDGHLGGLDSYVFTLDSAQNEDVFLEKLDNIIAAQKAAFITGIFDAQVVQVLGNAIAGKNIVLFNPDESIMWQYSKGSLHKLSTVDGQTFRSAMQKKYGYVPGVSAYRGYIAARLISTAVRSLARNPADNIEAATKALEQAQSSP